MPRPQDIADEMKKELLPKIEKQNAHLTQQVNELNEMLEMYAFKMHVRKNEKFSAAKYAPDDELKEKDKELFGIMKKMRHYQKEIKVLREALDESLNIDRIHEIENNIKIKRAKVQQLTDEKNSVSRI